MIDTCNLKQLSKKYKLNYYTINTLRSRNKDRFIKYLYTNGLRYISEQIVYYGKRKEIQITFEVMTTIPYSTFLNLVEENKKQILVSKNPEIIKTINLFPDYPKTGAENGFVYFKLTNDGKLIQVLYNEFQNYYLSEMNYIKYQKFFQKYNIDYNKFIPIHRGNYYFKIPLYQALDFIQEIKPLFLNKSNDENIPDFITKVKDPLFS